MITTTKYSNNTMYIFETSRDLPRLFAVTPPGEYKLTFWGKEIREFKFIRKGRGKKEKMKRKGKEKFKKGRKKGKKKVNKRNRGEKGSKN